MTNDQLAALILPWAKTNHPEKYAETLKVSYRPDTFRTYMLRLVEIRCEEDTTWRGEQPVSLLDETKMVLKVKSRTTGIETEYKGRKAKGEITHRILELGLDRETFDQLQKAKHHLDLEYIHD